MLKEDETNNLFIQKIHNWISHEKILKTASTLRRAQKPITEYFKKKSTQTNAGTNHIPDTPSKQMAQSNQTQILQESKKRLTKSNYKKIQKKLQMDKSTRHPHKPNLQQSIVTKNNNIQSGI